MIAIAFLALTFITLTILTVNLFRANRDGRVTITRGKRNSIG